jgi:hypothetical protein
MKNLKQYLKSLDACKPAVKWAGKKTIEEVVATCHRGDWLLWLAEKCDIGLQPLTLAKGHCANTVRHLMNDERSIRAVDIAIAFGKGKATREELDAADYAAADAARSAYAAAASTAADAAAYAAASAYAAAAASTAASFATAVTAAAYAAVTAAAVDYAADADIANRLQTADICRKYIGELIVEKVNQILTQ